MSKDEVTKKVCRAVLAASEKKKVEPRAEHRFVDDLGFDSLRMAVLAVALENELGQSLLLNDWIGGSDDPSELTVQSLVDYLHPILSEDA
jgi:acyl carrier protein